MSKKIGVILSGCGVMDGSEIHEAVITLLTIDKAGCEAIIMAPDINQAHVVDHLKGEPVEGESRNCLVEAARIARGNIKPVQEVNPGELDAIVMPGGFGAAKNLCNYAFKGPEMEVNEQVTGILQKVHQDDKPVCAVCISPVILSKVFAEINPTITIGNEVGTAKHIEEMGGKHQDCPVTEMVIDSENKIVTAPAYMYNARISEVAEGIEKAVNATIEMAG